MHFQFRQGRGTARLLLVVLVGAISAFVRLPLGETVPVEHVDAAVATVVVDSFLTDRAGGRAVWYPLLSQPHAVQHGGVTYVAFHGGGTDYLDPLVMSYNHQTGTTKGPVKVGENPLAPFRDTHGNPAIMVDHAGYIHVIFGGHGYYDGGKMTHAVSTVPGDISAWETLDTVNPVGTYPQLLKRSDGTIVYFYRAERPEAGNHRGDWVYVMSADNGRSFTRETPLLGAGRARNDQEYVDGLYYDAWYGHLFKGVDDTVHLIAQYHPCAHPFGDPHHAQRRFHLYHMQWKKGEAAWQNLKGEPVPLPLSREEADACCRVFSSGAVKGSDAMIQVVVSGFATTAKGHPYVVFRHGEGRWASRNPEWVLATGKHTDGIWDMQTIPVGGLLTVETNDALRLWGNTVFDSHDDGQTWIQVTDLSSALGGWALVYDGLPEARVVAHDLPTEYTDDVVRARKIYMWGNQGFVVPE